MSLEIVITTTQASDCKSFTLIDSTGSDSLSGSTKYSSGGSNTNIATSDIVITDVFIEDPKGNESSVSYLSDFPADGNNKTFTSTDLGQTLSGSSALYDGNYIINYYVWDSVGSGNISITTDTNTISTSVDLSTIFTAGSYIRLDGLPYKVESSTSSVITLETNFSGTTLTNSVNIYKGYRGYKVHLQYCKVQCCINNKIGDLPSKACNCKSKDVLKTLKMYVLLQKAIDQNTNSDYINSADTIDVLTEWCGDDDCNCNKSW